MGDYQFFWFCCLPELTSVKWQSEALSIGLNPLHSSGSRRLNPRDFSPAVLLSACARLGMGDSVMDGGRKIHPSNELMNKYISSVCADARGREIDICYILWNVRA